MQTKEETMAPTSIPLEEDLSVFCGFDLENHEIKDGKIVYQVSRRFAERPPVMYQQISSMHSRSQFAIFLAGYLEGGTVKVDVPTGTDVDLFGSKSSGPEVDASSLLRSG